MQPFRQTPKRFSHPANLFFFFRFKLKTLLLGFTSPFIPCFCHLASHLYVYLALYPLYVAWLPISVVCLCFAASSMENFGCTRCEMRLYRSVCLCGSVCVFVCVCEQLRVVAGLGLEGGPSCCLQVNSLYIFTHKQNCKITALCNVSVLKMWSNVRQSRQSWMQLWEVGSKLQLSRNFPSLVRQWYV